jgi:hypothetical protein
MSLTFARRRQSEAKKREKLNAATGKTETKKILDSSSQTKHSGEALDPRGLRQKEKTQKKGSQSSLHEQKD